MVCVCLMVSEKSIAQKKSTAFLNNPVVYINLMLPYENNLLLVDGTGALYSNKFSAKVDEDDAGKLSNRNENICLLRDKQKLAIETRPLPKQTDTLFINMWGLYYSKAYSLQISFKAIPLMLPVDAWLIDNYLHKQTAIDLFGKTLYNFSANKDSNSYVNRFKIVFIRNYQKEDEITSINKASTLNVAEVTAYPNPVTGNKLTLRFNDMPKDYYNIKLSGLSGEILSAQNIIHYGGSNEYYLPVNSVYTKGIYTVIISGRDTKKIIHLPVVIE